MFALILLSGMICITVIYLQDWLRSDDEATRGAIIEIAEKENPKIDPAEGFRNFTFACFDGHSRDVMQECSASKLPLVPQYVSSVLEEENCALSPVDPGGGDDFGGLLEQGLKFWNGIDFSRTRTVQGDVSMLQNALKKAQNGECLKIVVIGGSHCYGTCTKDAEKYCFGNLLAHFLNIKFPGDNCEHTSTGGRFCLQGTCSTTHAYSTRRQIEEVQPADIVLLEFANNDLSWESADLTNLFRYGWALEYIFRKWTASGVAVMFVQSSFRIKWDPSTNHYWAKTAEATHLEFQQTYHVPTISFSKGVLPEFWEQRFNESSKYYEKSIFGDYRVHMISRGHAIIASMVLKTFESILEETPEPFQLPEKLEFIPEDYFKRLDEDVIFQVNFNDKYDPVKSSFRWVPFVSGEGRINMSSGWNITDEGRKNKWGLISTTPGSYFTVALAKNAHSLYLTVLKSYVNMGVLQISLHNCTTGLMVPPMEEVDCLWNPESSQSYVYSMKFEAGACEFLNISVKHTDRLKNKVKIMTISLT
jgi:hypothetical protein